MSKWWHYPAWRRRALQAVMWALLGAMLGVAAIASSHRRAIKDARYSPPIACGQYIVHVPVDWNLILDSTAVLKVDARDGGRAARQKRSRRLAFYQAELRGGESLPDFLAAQNLLGSGPMPEDNGNQADEVTIAGYDGLVYWRSGNFLGNFERAEYTAATVSPDGQALAVRLTVSGPLTQADLLLFRDLLDRISRRPH